MARNNDCTRCVRNVQGRNKGFKFIEFGWSCGDPKPNSGCSFYYDIVEYKKNQSSIQEEQNRPLNTNWAEKLKNLNLPKEVHHDLDSKFYN